MVHGHNFYFTDEPQFNQKKETAEHPVYVKCLHNSKILDAYTIKRPWVPISGQNGRYFSKIPFEYAEENFSWGLEIREVLTVIWEADTKTIYYIKKRNYSPERLQFWIYHTFFPITLELNKFCHFLHVGAVEVKGKTLFFSAPSFGGKSTLTDYFIQQGATLVSDDALGIVQKGHSYCALPAYPFHRPYREPEVLGYKVEKFASEVKAVNAIFLLQKTDANGKVAMTELKGIDKFKALHHAVFIEFPFRKKERFQFFGKMAESVPVYQIDIPWDLKRLDEVYLEILNII